jgi:hypothetical protein
MFVWWMIVCLRVTVADFVFYMMVVINGFVCHRNENST